jgi:hypothetical protein
MAPAEEQTLDELRDQYKQAVDAWIETIRAEEALANVDGSEVAYEHWDKAHFTEEDGRNAAKAARDRYKDALRKLHYGI